ncbi:hypothetical protein [Methylobacterium organophilum]|uniref:Uncharacterized protein n=1 Tax=Methylobacterium organophilum TaxID=410 RepID=A0ABQ4T3P2_METOR|nr:hypothetical protein [Methylobacterium organophilum]GJE26250.1 hypothetical protein LKMONMHP_1099 [Methylobacterium organophilum]
MIDTVVSRILAGFEQGRGRSDEENEILVGEYIEALQGLPIAAIHKAAGRFRSGETLLPWSRRWRPSPAEFAAEAREALIPLRRRLLHVRQILEAEVYEPPSEADRAKVEAEARRYLEQRHAVTVERDQAEPTAAEVELARRGETAKAAAALREAADPQTIGRLMANLDARTPRRVERAGG